MGPKNWRQTKKDNHLSRGYVVQLLKEVLVQSNDLSIGGFAKTIIAWNIWPRVLLPILLTID